MVTEGWYGDLPRVTRVDCRTTSFVDDLVCILDAFAQRRALCGGERRKRKEGGEREREREKGKGLLVGGRKGSPSSHGCLLPRPHPPTPSAR